MPLVEPVTMALRDCRIMAEFRNEARGGRRRAIRRRFFYTMMGAARQPPELARVPFAAGQSVAFRAPLRYIWSMTVSRPAHRCDHSHAAGGGESALTAALALCREEGIALTPGRRRILEILAREGRPLGAYDLIERVAALTGKRPAPISIYRALDFLLENSLVHRLASRNAYLACGHAHARQAAIAFLICECCGEVLEADSGALSGSLKSLASEAHFSPRAQVMEVTGLCRVCAGQ